MTKAPTTAGPAIPGPRTRSPRIKAARTTARPAAPTSNGYRSALPWRLYRALAHPELRAALRSVPNAFLPWQRPARPETAGVTGRRSAST